MTRDEAENRAQRGNSYMFLQCTTEGRSNGVWIVSRAAGDYLATPQRIRLLGHPNMGLVLLPYWPCRLLERPFPPGYHFETRKRSPGHSLPTPMIGIFFFKKKRETSRITVPVCSCGSLFISLSFFVLHCNEVQFLSLCFVFPTNMM